MAKMGVRLYAYYDGWFWRVLDIATNNYVGKDDEYIKLDRVETELINFVHCTSMVTNFTQYPMGGLRPIRRSIMSFDKKEGLDPLFKFFTASTYDELISLSLERAEEVLEENKYGQSTHDGDIITLVRGKVKEYNK